MKRFPWLIVAGALAIIALLAPAVLRSARAQTTETQRAFVYGINAAIPDNFVGTFAPPSAETIYLLAGDTSVISPRYTEIYFWPITNEYRANWHALNDSVPGVLEISQNGAVVAELESTDYTIQFTQEGTTNATGKLYVGQPALDADKHFRDRQAAFLKASDAYDEAERKWLDAAADAGIKKQQGEDVTLPPEPKLPDPIGIFSNGLNKGMPVNLEPGQYSLRMRDANGKTVPGSDKTLVVFAPRRTGVGYTVVPETRWTTPLESPGPDDIIFGTAGSTIYLEPHQAREYPAREWALLQDPQRAAGDAGGWQWVNGEALTEGKLDVIAGDRVVDQHTLTPYKVNQSPGSQLGYTVTEFTPGTGAAPNAPDFEAYSLKLDAAGQRYEIRLASPQGEPLAGSARQVNAPQNPPFTRLLVLPILPLLFGAVVLNRRQSRVKMPRGMTG